ncbi:hypothetical protein MJG53_020044, partial [Ovis ammon polii x Ovis aries]
MLGSLGEGFLNTGGILVYSVESEGLELSQQLPGPGKQVMEIIMLLYNVPATTAMYEEVKRGHSTGPRAHGLQCLQFPGSGAQ